MDRRWSLIGHFLILYYPPCSLHSARCDLGVGAPLLSLRSPVFLGDRDCYCAVNVQLTELLCRRSAHSVSAVVDVGHYDYTDMVWISPTMFRAMGVMRVAAAQRMELHHFIADSCLAFLSAHCSSVAGELAALTLRARWVTLRARWVMLRARWVTL